MDFPFFMDSKGLGGALEVPTVLFVCTGLGLGYLVFSSFYLVFSKVAYLQALMDNRFHAHVMCDGDIATMVDLLQRVQVAAARAVLKGQKGGGEEVPGDENNSLEVAVRKATEKEAEQHVHWLAKYFVRIPDHEQVTANVFRKVWAHVVSGMNMSGCLQFPLWIVCWV